MPHIGARRPPRVPRASRDNTGNIPDTFMDSGTPMAPLRTNHAASRAPRAHSTQPVDGQQGSRTRPENVSFLSLFWHVSRMSTWFPPVQPLGARTRAEGARGAREAPGSVRGGAVGVPESITMPGMFPVLSLLARGLQTVPGSRYKAKLFFVPDLLIFRKSSST